MMVPRILVATWNSGLFTVSDAGTEQEFADRSVRGLTRDGAGGFLAILSGHCLSRRGADGQWRGILHSPVALSCCLALPDGILAGSDDARLLWAAPDGSWHWLDGFDRAEGRELWYAGAALVDGRLMGPPLGIRSLAASCDARVWLANVHVGGVPRSLDGGQTWSASLDIAWDIHQVCAHPDRPELMIAAAAVGLCVSSDGGAHWQVEQSGLHALHCSAVGFGRDHLFISAASDQFTDRALLYHRPIDSAAPLRPVTGGLPSWLAGVVDTGCIACQGEQIAIIDRAGHLYHSGDDGVSWRLVVDGLAGASGVELDYL